MTSIVATLSNLLNLPNPPGKLEALLYPDYVVTEITAAPEGGLELHLQPTALPICSRCGKPSLKLHETRHRRIREVPFPGCSAVWISLRSAACAASAVATLKKASLGLFRTSE